LPVGPGGPPREGVAQIVNLNAKRVSSTNLFTGETLPPDSGRTAETIVITGTAEEVQRILGQLPPNVRVRAYEGPTYETTTLIPQQDHPAAVQPCAGAAIPPVSAPVSANPGKYYVLDFFQATGPEPCPHGKRVQDVIQQQLGRAGKTALAANVVPIEVDFFRNQQALKPYLDAYIARQDPLDQPILVNAVKALQQRKLATVGKYEVPILYLQAVYDHALRDNNAYIVSSSFFTVGSPFSLLPQSLASNTRVLLMAAVADDPGNIEDYQLEPIRTLWNYRRDNPVLLVGALLGGKTQFGMSSQAGDGVSCVGDGDGWGSANSCIKPDEKGTSFATPGVAAAIFVARHGLPANGARSAKDWRDRTLRAVRIIPSLAGRYSAPGVPQASWLASASPAVVFGDDVAPHPVTIKEGKVSYATLDGTEETTIVFSRDRCSGIQTVAGRWFIFRSTAGQWQEVNVKSVDLTICTETGERKLSLADFTSDSMKGIVYL